MKEIKTTQNFRHLRDDRLLNIRGTVLEGGSRCFGENTKVILKGGIFPIKFVHQGDQVLTYNEQTQEEEYRRVVNVHKFTNDKTTIKINFKNGQSIVVTEDHKFYYDGQWVPIKDILNADKTK